MMARELAAQAAEMRCRRAAEELAQGRADAAVKLRFMQQELREVQE